MHTLHKALYGTLVRVARINCGHLKVNLVDELPDKRRASVETGDGAESGTQEALQSRNKALGAAQQTDQGP